jgi:hypothetical protein
MKMTFNKPAEDVYVARERCVRFVLTDTDVFMTPKSAATDASTVEVQRRTMGGFALEVDGDLERKIIDVLRPPPGKPFYRLLPDQRGIRLVFVSERPARHVPYARLWRGSEAEETEPASDAEEELPNLSPDGLWAIYANARDLMQTSPSGRPSKEFIAARNRMGMFKRIARDVDEEFDMRPITEAIEILSNFRARSRLPRRFSYDAKMVGEAVWKAEHLDNPTLVDQLEKLVMAARLVEE